MHAKSPSRSRALLSSFLAGFVIYSLGWLLDRILQYSGLNSKTVTLDDLLIAVLVGVVVLFYEERRRRTLVEKLHTIELMNHHVRNALQVIACAHHTPDQQRQVQIVSESVQRIEWALKEVLPKKGKDIPAPPQRDSSAA